MVDRPWPMPHRVLRVHPQNSSHRLSQAQCGVFRAPAQQTFPWAIALVPLFRFRACSWRPHWIACIADVKRSCGTTRRSLPPRPAPALRPHAGDEGATPVHACLSIRVDRPTLNARSCMHIVPHTTVADFQPCAPSLDRHPPPRHPSSRATRATPATRLPHLRARFSDGPAMPWPTTCPHQN
jgi:hypothetical protein